MTRPDDAAPAAWQQETTVRWYLDSVRGAIPFAREQFAVATSAGVQRSRFCIVRTGAGSHIRAIIPLCTKKICPFTFAAASVAR